MSSILESAAPGPERAEYMGQVDSRHYVVDVYSRDIIYPFLIFLRGVRGRGCLFYNFTLIYIFRRRKQGYLIYSERQSIEDISHLEKSCSWEIFSFHITIVIKKFSFQ